MSDPNPIANEAKDCDKIDYNKFSGTKTSARPTEQNDNPSVEVGNVPTTTMTTSTERKKVPPIIISSKPIQNFVPTTKGHVLNQQPEDPMANDDYIDVKIFKWEIENMLSLKQLNGEYLESESFSSKGPYGQPEVKWALRLYPRGNKGVSQNNVSIYLHLLDGNGSNYLKVDWELAIINANGNKLNQQKHESCLFDKSEIPEGSWYFENFISRPCLANGNNNYIVEGHKLILYSKISVHVEKDLQAELLEKNKQTMNLKRKLEKKEEEMQKVRSEYELVQKRSRTENEKLKGDHLAVIKKLRKEQETSSNQMRCEHEIQLQDHRAQIAILTKEKAELEKCRKDEVECLNREKSAALEKYNKEKERSNKLNSLVKRLREENGKLAENLTQLSNSVRNSSKLVEKIEKDNDKSAECSAKMGPPH